MFVKYHAELAAYRREYMEKAEAGGKEAWVEEAQSVWAEEVQVLNLGESLGVH